jgi:hypothetical protein
VRTARFIEEQKEGNAPLAPEGRRKRGPRGKPFAKGNGQGVEHRFKQGESGNPGGKPGTDVAAIIARRVIEENQDAICEGFAAQLIKGNAYAFNVLADRGYGKMKDGLELSGLDGLADRLAAIRKAKVNSDIDRSRRTD